MAHIIDTRHNGGDLVVLGDSVVVPTSTSTETGIAGGLRRNPNNGAIEAYVGVDTGAYLWRSITPGIGGGGVLEITAGTGLTGGTISDTGTIGLSNTGVTAGNYTFAVITVNAQGRITAASSGSPVTNVVAGTGLTGGPITTTGTISLSNTTVNAGTYAFPVIVVDAQGRLTSASTQTAVIAIAAGTGLSGGTITSAGVIALANTAVTPGTYTRATVVVDAQGRLTSASNGTAVTSVASGTGLTGGPITGTGTISLANTAVTPGTYTVSTIVVDAQGRITSATNGVAGGGGGSGTVTSVASGTGLTGGPITGTGTISLANTTVTPGTYTVSSIVVDAQGRITSASNGSAAAGTVTSVAAGTGLTGGPVTGSGTLSLADTTVSAGTYPLARVVVDAQGRITNATSLEATSDDKWYARRNGAWVAVPYDIFLAASDETTTITTGTAKVTFRVKRAMALERISAELNTTSSSGSVTVDVNRAGVSVLSAAISIAAASLYADTTSFVTINLAVGDVITVDIDAAGTGAKGLKVALLGWLI